MKIQRKIQQKIQPLLTQISELIKANQRAGAICNFYWVLHIAMMNSVLMVMMGFFAT